MREHLNDAQLLREALRGCQEELARVRVLQEPLMEELARERELRAKLERQNSRLATAVEQRLLTPYGGSGWSSRIRRRIRRTRLARAREWREADLVAKSRLFSSSWYLGRYPEVLQTGLPPALHYVRHGAREGKDPSDEFSTKRYLEAHPDVRSAGENPLVHHERNERVQPRGR